MSYNFNMASVKQIQTIKRHIPRFVSPINTCQSNLGCVFSFYGLRECGERVRGYADFGGQVPQLQPSGGMQKGRQPIGFHCIPSPQVKGTLDSVVSPRGCKPPVSGCVGSIPTVPTIYHIKACRFGEYRQEPPFNGAGTPTAPKIRDISDEI